MAIEHEDGIGGDLVAHLLAGAPAGDLLLSHEMAFL
jgi:hypothetical protein